MKTNVLTLCAFLIAPQSSKGEQQSPNESKSGVVVITRYFSPEEKIAEPGFVGVRSIAWYFKSRKYLVTVEHTVTEPALPKDRWTDVEITHQENLSSKVKVDKCKIRLAFTVLCPGENLVILELQDAICEGPILTLQKENLVEGDKIFGFAYSNDEFRDASGTFHCITDSTNECVEKRDFALVELFNENDRMLFDHGSSGSPIFNEKGEVVAVISKIIYQEIDILGKKIRVSTPWGSPTNTAVPITKLLDFKMPED